MVRRTAAPTATLAPPADVRAMNLAAALLFGVALLVFAALLVGWLLRLPQFTLRSVQVGGDVTRNSVTTIRANAGPKLAGNFFSVDLAHTQQAFESVPWVRRALVRRVWPDRLAVQLEEHRVAAWWQVDEGDNKLVNVQGEVFEANPGDVEDEGLPTLRGPEGSAATVLAMQRRLAPLFGRIDLAIDTLAVSARGSWRAELDSGARVEIGRGSEDEVAARVQAFTGSLGQLMARYQRPLESADLRHAEGYALRLRGIGTVVPETKN